MSETKCQKCDGSKRVSTYDALGTHVILCRACVRAFGLVVYLWPEYIALRAAVAHRSVLESWPITDKTVVTLDEATRAAVTRAALLEICVIPSLRAFRDRLDVWFDDASQPVVTTQANTA